MGDVSKKSQQQFDRMMIWRASLTIEVSNVTNAVAQLVVLAEKQGGYVEKQSLRDRDSVSASVTLRIPSQVFSETITDAGILGKITRQSVSGEDVTERYVDTEAALKNRIALRDRLSQLLEKADSVQDILAIETELNRTQTEIDVLEGRIKLLKGSVDYATIVVDLESKQILGPVGYVFQGIWWGVKKLFIIQE